MVTDYSICTKYLIGNVSEKSENYIDILKFLKVLFSS